MQQESFALKYWKRLIVFFGVLFLALIVLAVINSLKFHLVNTDPSISNVSDLSPYLKLNFNDQLMPNQHVQLSSTKNIASFSNINDKTLTLKLKTPSSYGEEYSVNIASVESTSGKYIKNIQLSFKSKYTTFSGLSSDQQKAVLNQQKEKQTTSFLGVNALINYGFTTSQVAQLESYIKQFDPQAKSINFVTSNLTQVRTNTSSGTVFTANYSIIIDGVTYSASSSYLGNNISLSLYNQAGSLVYRAGEY